MPGRFAPGLNLPTCSILLVLLLVSCREKEPVPPATGSIHVRFQNTAGSSPLVLDTGQYINEHGDTFRVTACKYYVSNFSFIKEDGGEVETGGYYLVDQSDPASQGFTVTGLPPGRYKGLKFLIGVDSLRNVSGAQDGALDGIHGMFWDWSTGYIMAKLEGYSPQSGDPGKLITFHIGGFSGIYNTLRWAYVSLPERAVADGPGTPEIHMRSDVLEWFKNPDVTDFSMTYAVTGPGKHADAIADNYADMFSVDHVRN